ncbi:MAG: uroporphyrinogen-III synthase [Candidatus Bathyarchaeota archaeon]|nr:uroporphyrinogen-III synthase [Candidatus Bathyarchaeota archaeon]
MVQKTPNLNGKTIAITRPAGQIQEAQEQITALGGKPYFIPAIEIKGLTDFSQIKQFITELKAGSVDWVVFMSTNGIKHLLEAAKTLKQTTDLMTGLATSFVVAVGPKTAEACLDFGVHVDMVPAKYSSEGLIETIKDMDLRGKKIRIPRTTSATPILKDKLKEMGADVQEIYVYESGLPVDEELKARFYEDLSTGRIDAVVFGSGLSVKNIFKMLTEKATPQQVKALLNGKVTTVAIGPTTAEALKELGVKVDVMPQNYLFERALSDLVRFWG